MPALVVLLDGLGDDFLRESMDAGHAACLASILRAGGVAHFYTPEVIDTSANCASALTGVWADQHRILGREEPDGTGHLRAIRGQRRAVCSVPEIADRTGRRCLLVNIPFIGPPANPDTVAVTERFFSPAAVDSSHGPAVYPEDLLNDLRPLLVAPSSIGDAHLGSLSPGLLQLAPTDRRRAVAAALLARAISIQNTVTSLAETDEFDFVGVRFDTLDLFFSAYIDHWPNPQPYISETEAAHVAGVLPAAIELHDHFIQRLIHLISPRHVIVCSGHGYWRELRRHVPIGTPESFQSTVTLADSPQRPAVVREFQRPEGWMCWNDPALGASIPDGVDALTNLADLMGSALGLSPAMLRTRRPDAEPLPERTVLDERRLDDLVELGLVRLPDLLDARREQSIQDTLRVEAVHARLSGDSTLAVTLLTALFRRIFDFADVARLLQALLDDRRYAEALHLSQTVSRLAPGSVLAYVALARARFGCNDPVGGQEALELAAGVDPDDPRVAQTAARHGLLALIPRKLPPFATVDHSAGATFLLERPMQWWRDVEQHLAPRLAALDTAHDRLCSIAVRAPRDLSSLAAPIREPLHQATYEQRLRIGSISSLSRHAHVDQLDGLTEAREMLLDNDALHDTPLIRLVCELHSKIYAMEPKMAGTYRADPAHALRSWLDGQRESLGIFSGPDVVARDMERLQAAMEQRLTVHPAVLAGAVPIDFCSVHPFVDGNGRTSRLLMQHLMLRGGYTGVKWINLERRMDRCRAIYESSLVHTRATDSNASIEFVVEFFRDAFDDAATRLERLIADYEAAREAT